MVQIAVLGYGTVGSGVVEVFEKNQEVIAMRAGDTLNVKYILDLRDFPGDPHEAKLVHDVNVVMEDEEVAVVCETMGGVGAAYQFTKMALERGKSVCTSNKELVAAHGPELLEIAREHQCNYMFEASVGGGIPIIRSLNQSMTAEIVEQIDGILNGTTNYILTKMAKEGADFSEVLRKAQEKGYAERNPEADIDGHDARRKVAILASLMMGKTVDAERIYTEGIRKITSADISYAKAAGKLIKLMGISKRMGDQVLVMVAPFLVGPDDPLYMVDGVFNGICVRSNMLGDSMYYGKGAGKLPTASAVAADVIDCAKHLGENIMCFWTQEQAVIADLGNVEHQFFLRVKTGAKEAVEAVFPGGRFLVLPERTQDLGYFTGTLREKDFADRCELLGDVILGRIRVEI